MPLSVNIRSKFNKQCENNLKATKYNLDMRDLRDILVHSQAWLYISLLGNIHHFWSLCQCFLLNQMQSMKNIHASLAARIYRLKEHLNRL